MSRPWVCVAGLESTVWTDLGPLSNGLWTPGSELPGAGYSQSAHPSWLICWSVGSGPEAQTVPGFKLALEAAAHGHPTPRQGADLQHRIRLGQQQQQQLDARATQTAGRQVSGNPTWIRQQPIHGKPATKGTFCSDLSKLSPCIFPHHYQWMQILRLDRFWWNRPRSKFDTRRKPSNCSIALLTIVSQRESSGWIDLLITWGTT